MVALSLEAGWVVKVDGVRWGGNGYFPVTLVSGLPRLGLSGCQALSSSAH